MGISIARYTDYGSEIIAENISAYVGKNKFKKGSICFEDKYVLDGYGNYNSRIIDIIKQLLTQDSISLDTTYTGKAFWGMIEYLKEHSIESKTILFVHTGGLPLFFDKLATIFNNRRRY